MNWEIKYRPIGAFHWKAQRFGVSITANSKEELLKIIRLRDNTYSGVPSKPPSHHEAVQVDFGPIYCRKL